MADSNCTHDCSSCGSACGDRTAPQDPHLPLGEGSHIKQVIAVMSGKGGVGKSSVTACLAAALRKTGKTVGVLDADLTGPSIPKLFGIRERAVPTPMGIAPVETATGIKLMSLNLLTANETDPVVWRGPVIANVVKQFWSDVVWGEVDYMFVDMPPGTGDVAITVFQSLPVDGIVMVTSPQQLASMIVTKAVKMANEMKVPILGIIENFSGFKCPDCGSVHAIFGESHAGEIAKQYGLTLLAKLPIDPALASAGDQGKVEKADLAPFTAILKQLKL